MTKRAQDILVDRFLDWGRVEERLGRYPHIAETYPMGVLRSGVDQPYGVHYLAWRLGVWGMEELFERFDQLLAVGSMIPGWERERTSLAKKTEYATFYSLVWQLQVAEFLRSKGWDLEWQPDGAADLRCSRDGRKLFVECYQPKWAHSTELFIEDVLRSVGDDIRVEHDLFRPLRLPQREASEVIDCVLRRFAFDDALAKHREAARRVHTHVVFADYGLRVVLEGGNPDAPVQLDNAVLDPVQPFARDLRRIIETKAKKKNQFAEKPNLLAVNTLLVDAQYERVFDHRFRIAGFPDIQVPTPIDAVAYAPLGIDAKLNTECFELVRPAPEAHPVHQLGLRWAGARYGG